MVKLSIIIPAYNEEKRIVKTLEQYTAYFDKQLKKKYEIFVAINGCTDNTLSVVKKFAKKNQTVNYKDFGKVNAKGDAIIQAFHIINTEYVGFVDADCATPPHAFYALYTQIGSADGIIASRWMKGAIMTPKQPLKRRIASRCFNLLVRILFLLPYKDTQTGAKLFKKTPLKSILPELGHSRWGFDIDLLYILRRHGYKVKETPTEWHDDSYSHLRIAKASFEMFLSVIRLRLIYSPFRFLVHFYNTIIDFFTKKKKN
jgi:glycosyltransferase involved in cell wall biosynthesis